jgi:hypothetical protein
MPAASERKKNPSRSLTPVRFDYDPSHDNGYLTIERVVLARYSVFWMRQKANCSKNKDRVPDLSHCSQVHLALSFNPPSLFTRDLALMLLDVSKLCNLDKWQQTTSIECSTHTKTAKELSLFFFFFFKTNISR